MKGRKLSEIHKINISKSLLNKNLSEETKLKISLSLSLKNHPSLKNYEKKYKPIIMTDINDNIIKTFKGVRITMKEFKISQNKLKDIIENKKIISTKRLF